MKLLTIFLFSLLFSYHAGAQSRLVKFTTSKGEITVMLYDKTPKHRDMFLSSIKSGLYRDALFNRVIKSFVSQAGELDESILEREKQHPELPLKRVAAEIDTALFHKKGALGAGRNDNPEKSSYINQIYFVAGKIHTDAQLDAIEKRKGSKFSKKQREVYKTIGGTPHLDGDYTVFGEIITGMDVAEAINSVQTNKDDLPLEPVLFNIKTIKKNRR
ncbi:peptidylprolyl isomerase [Pedobacter psychroterrae]|uniref:peptidylprolyl isomerase n=1 Tax=Pedobacter psychroterrae TaxID=2530453 RepID=A0A4R0NLH5_9SPHI|nr:peptidylprolyl isomerase [Pedobacter psychroterrae]TCC99874.1 peptidylprolyl isomerase [Pedobacter psychroterrae]